MSTKKPTAKASHTPNKRARQKARKWTKVNTAWPWILERSPYFGPVVYRVDSRRMVANEMTGKRVEFPTLEAAQVEATTIRDRYKMHGAAANISATSTNEAQMAMRLLLERAPGVGLLDAVKGYVELVAKVRNPVTVAELAKQYAESKQRKGRSAGHLKDLKFRLKKFGEKFGKKMVHEITGEQVEKWIEGMKLMRGVGADGESQTISAGSQSNYWRNLGGFFSYAVVNGHAARNPLEGRERPKVQRGEVGILTVDELTRLLAVADERIVPALAIGAFAGLRPESEIVPLQWEDINLDKVLDEDKSTKKKPVYKSFGWINVKRSKNKKSLRHVPVSENLHDWLIDRKPPQGGPVVPVAANYLHELRQAAVEDAKIKKYPHDGLRHSFGSYHRALHMDDGRTATLMGHTNIRTFREHYCHSLPPGAAEAYWNIFPTVRGERKIVPLAQAGAA
jgi:integrase